MNDYNLEYCDKEFSQYLSSDDFLFIDSIFIFPAFQGQGLDRKIFDDINEQHLYYNIKDCFLIADLNQKQETNSFNLISFYEINGFSIVKEINKNYYLMIKRLY